MVALSAPGHAQPAMAAPEAGREVDRDGLWRGGDPSDFWFFGDGGYGCPLWWCGDQGTQAGGVGVAPQRGPRPDPRSFWFFGDGGLGCPQGACGSHRQAPEGR